MMHWFTVDTSRWAWAALALLAWLGLTGRIYWRARREAQARTVPVQSDNIVLVAYASQSGFGQELAQASAAALTAQGQQVRVLPLAELDLPALQSAQSVWFIVSSAGEGDPPDNAVRFVRQCMAGTASLQNLHYGLLALGDSSYAHYCGFGRALDGWLQANGASSRFPRIEVDNGSPAALAQWQAQIGTGESATFQPTNTVNTAPWRVAEPQAWRLTGRQCLNPGSPGKPVYHLSFESQDMLPHWQAGDIAQITLPPNPALDAQDPPRRDYSLASLPAYGKLELLVRLHRQDDGRLGRASGWLTQELALGASVPIHLRTNKGFHPVGANLPIILIGNGTGLAGLRAHLKQRAADWQVAQKNHTPCAPAWLMFGERTRQHDCHWQTEMQQWRQQGVLQRLDYAFSRDANSTCAYVQQLVRLHATLVEEWVNQGAVIFICGQRNGMAKGVHEELVTILGQQKMDALIEAGRYRRDVY